MPTTAPPRPQGASPPQRPRPSLTPISIGMVVLFVGVAVGQLATRTDHVAFRWGMMLRFFVVGPILIAGVLALAAGGIAALLAPGRRAGLRTFNVGFSAILLLLTGLRVAIMTGVLSGGGQSTTAPPEIAATSGPSPSTATRRTGTPPTRRPSTPSAATPSASPRANAPTTTAAPPAPPPVIDTAPALDPFFAELAAECDAVATEAKTAYIAVTVPGRTAAELDAQIASFRALEGRVDALITRLMRIVSEGKDKLEPIGVTGVDAHRAVLVRDESFNSFERLTACQEIRMFAQSAAELFEEIKPVRAKVQVTKQGSITSADHNLDHRLFLKRSPVDSWRERSDEVMFRLREGKTK